MPLTALLLLQLMGCDAFRKAFSSLDGLTTSSVLQGAVMGVDLPDDERLTPLLEGTDFAPGMAVTVFLADASSLTDLANAPVSNALVTVDGNISEAIPSQGNGLYATDPSTSDLEYEAGATWTVEANVGGTSGFATLVLPADADFEIPSTQGLNQQLSVDLSGQGFASAVVVVINQTGNVVFTNLPTDIKSLYDQSQQDEAGLIEIPGSTFAANGLYAVGVAPMAHTQGDDLTDLNTLLSGVRTGQMRLTAVVVGP